VHSKVTDEEYANHLSETEEYANHLSETEEYATRFKHLANHVELLPHELIDSCGGFSYYTCQPPNRHSKVGIVKDQEGTVLTIIPQLFQGFPYRFLKSFFNFF
jgi:hypothetical protein